MIPGFFQKTLNHQIQTGNFESSNPDKILDKDKQDWENFLSSDEKLDNKDFKFN